ncbi:MAG: hypothetical protein U0P30_03925 [Vicinamibacterales bacterium]
MTRRPLPLALVALTLAMPAPAWAAPGAAKGYFRLHQTRSTFSSACAFLLPDPSGEATGVTHVVLSDKPLDCEAADRSFDPVEAVKAQVAAKKPAFVIFTVPTAAARVERLSGNWTSTDPDDGFSFGGQGTVAVAVNTRERAQGRYFMASPEKFFDKTFQFDFSWDAPVLSGFSTATPLAAGGGAAGAAYQKYLTALGRGDVAALRAVVTAARGADMNVKGAEAKDLVKFLQLFELKTATVVTGAERDDAAVLYVKGTGFDASPNTGRVLLQREGGAWKVAKVIMKSPL